MDSDDFPSSSDSYERELCRVCGQAAHGTHFEAVTCRACAAFFKRAIIGKYHELKCQSENGRCETSKNGRFYCKKCRLARCIASGMNEEKFQFNHDLIRTTNNFVISRKQKRVQLRDTIPYSMSTFLGRPHCIISCEPELASKEKHYIDVRFLLDKATKVFNKNSSPIIELNGMNGLGRMAHGLYTVRQTKNDDFKLITKLGKDETLYLCEEDFLLAANWLTYCDGFQTLPDTAKLQILKCVWQLWIRLEKIALTAEMRLKKKCPDNLVMAAKEMMFHCDEVDIDVTWCSNYPKDKIKYFLDPEQNIFLDEVVKPMMRLQPTPVEQAYMLAELCFEFAGKTFQGSILEATEQIHENISNDLHDYYVNEMKLPNYSSRLAQLMKLTNIIKMDLMERIEKRDLARVFDIFNVEFSHPEMFYKYTK